MSVKSGQYINIPGWAACKLHLKGNDLIVYSIIYGFSQEEGQYFYGSLKHIQEWTNSTKQGIIKNIDNLVKKGLIIKEDSFPTNKLYANLDIVKEILGDEQPAKQVNIVTPVVNTVTKEVNSVNDIGKDSLPNNINNSIINKNKYKAQVELQDKVEEIISYFNTICNTSFKSTTAGTKKVINARLKEGFTVDDFKKVIDCKYESWGTHPFKFKNGQMSNEYLRPSTLFSDKFESYIYEANCKESSEGHNQFDSISVKADDNDRVDITF